jgi:hypothetical protein
MYTLQRGIVTRQPFRGVVRLYFSVLTFDPLAKLD